MQIVVVGANHNSSSVQLRERLWVGPDDVAEVVRRLRELVAEVFVVSTCNRVELYAVCGHEITGTELLRQFLADRSGLPLSDVRAATYACGHEAAVRHALLVAAGLDSLVLGEDEILGQMRRAADASRQAGGMGTVLDRLTAAALGCGKRVRSTTKPGWRRQSMASLGLRAAVHVRGSLAGTRIAIIGAGETAALTLAELAHCADAQPIIINRTFEVGHALAAAHGAQVRPWDQLEQLISEVDVVFACTSATAPVLSAESVRRARDPRTERPLLCVDLGMPRDIDPAVGTLPGVTLLDIDSLHAEASTTRGDGSDSVRLAEGIVAEETKRFMEWWRGRSVASTIARLHDRADAISASEVERALARLPELSPRGQAVVTELAVRLVGKLLHEPTLMLKRDPEGANMALVVERLFALRDVAADDLAEMRVPECHVATGETSPNLHKEQIQA